MCGLVGDPKNILGHSHMSCKCEIFIETNTKQKTIHCVNSVAIGTEHFFYDQTDKVHRARPTRLGFVSSKS